jgi:hypothetical protein
MGFHVVVRRQNPSPECHSFSHNAVANTTHHSPRLVVRSMSNETTTKKMTAADSSPMNIATISAGFEKGDFLVREEQGNRVYFDFFEEVRKPLQRRVQHETNDDGHSV